MQVINGLNTVFEDLNDRVCIKIVNVNDNPGTDACNKSIATDKGWHVM
jgi:hypothetical protein